MTSTPELHLVQPLLAHDEIEALSALYAAIAGREAKPQELKQARELLAQADSLPDERTGLC